MGSSVGYPMGGMGIADADTGRGPRGGEPAYGAAEAAGGATVLAQMPPHPRRPGPALMRVGRLDPVAGATTRMAEAWETQARDEGQQRRERQLAAARACIEVTATDAAAGTRRCAICAAWLPAEAFHRNAADGLLGRSYRCKACLRAKPAMGATNGNPSEGTMGFQVVRRGRARSNNIEHEVRFERCGYGLLVPDDMARAVGIDRHVVVLWDAGTRRLALRPAGADDNGDQYLVRAVGRQRRLSSTMAFRLAGVTRTRSCPARVEDGMVVVDVGAPDAEEAAA